MQKVNVSTLPANIINKIKVRIRSFCQVIEQKWLKSGRYRKKFLIDNSSWLEGYWKLPNDLIQVLSNSKQKSVGRPQKPFEACGSKAQRSKIKKILNSTSQNELFVATEIKLRQQGKRDSAPIVKELTVASPRRGTIIKKARMSDHQTPGEFSADQALALIVDANLSTHQYNLIRTHAKNKNNKLYPAYYKVKEAKKLCYPTEINITETSAEIQLQTLIDHTVLRLCKAQQEVLETFYSSKKINLNIIIKWGCDGAEQNKYRQKFSAENCTDESLFSICMVPLQIYSENKDCNSIIWQNPAPSSTRYCRPIKFLFAKETVELINTEVKKIKNQVSLLSPTKIVVNGVETLVKAKMIFCMVDGKVCNAVASCASTQTCYLCGAKPREMNNSNIISQKTVNKNFLSFGLSPLHSWIRFFECLLHISYRLEIKTWQVRGESNKNKVAQKKKQVQEDFRNKLSLLVDMPKQQVGNTNNGNTARVHFLEMQKSLQK